MEQLDVNPVSSPMKSKTDFPAVLTKISDKQMNESEPAVDINNPSETDISDEGILNTQESVLSVKEKEIHDGLPLSQESIMVVEGVELNHIKTVEVKRSDRLKRDIVFTTKEKNERMARKRNPEGTSSYTMFSELPIETVKNLSSNMGWQLITSLLGLLACLEI